MFFWAFGPGPEAFLYLLGDLLPAAAGFLRALPGGIPPQDYWMGGTPDIITSLKQRKSTRIYFMEA